MSTRRSIMMKKSSDIPAEYSKVSYIANTIGTNGAYIDLGFRPTNDDVISIDFQFTNLSNYSAWACLLGSKVTGKRIGFMLNNDGSTWALRWGASATNAGAIDTEPHTLTIDHGVFAIDGTTIATLTDSTFTAGNNAFLFVENTGGVLGGYAIAKVSAMTIGSRVYVPCRRKADAVYGLYEKTNGEFRTSATSVPLTGGE